MTQLTRREQRQRRFQRGAADPSLIPHGTEGGYSNWGCRCEECMVVARRVWRESHERRRQRRRSTNVGVKVTSKPIST